MALTSYDANGGTGTEMYLSFRPLICTIDISVWRAVRTAKLSSWKLSTPFVPVRGKLVLPQPLLRNTGEALRPAKTTTGLGWRLHLENDTFFSSHENCFNKDCDILVEGTFFNANTVEDFRAINRHCLVEELMTPVVAQLQEARAFIEKEFLKNETCTEDTPTTTNDSTVDENKNGYPTTVSSCSNFDDAAFIKLQKKCVQLFVGFVTIPKLLHNISTTSNIISNVTRFFLLCFADIKSHLFYYNISIPSFRPFNDCFKINMFLIPQFSFKQWDCIKEALFKSTTNNPLEGFFGCCALLLKKPEKAYQHVSSDQQYPSSFWPELLIQASQDATSSLYRYTRSLVLDDVEVAPCCLIPLWLLLLLANMKQRELSNQETAEKNATDSNSNLLDFGTCEGIVICVDAGDYSYITSDKKNSHGAVAYPTIGWPLRLTLFVLGYLGLAGGPLPLLIFRDYSHRSLESFENMPLSIGITVFMPPKDSFLLPEKSNNTRQHFRSIEQQRDPLIKGWLRGRTFKTIEAQQNNQTSSSVTFVVDLRRHLDPVVAQADAVQLNVQLIQWRLLPAFDAQKLQSLRFLLIGMGTLGCSVARNLIGWGATRLTLVDNGYVAFSSPVRQALYTHADAAAREGRGRLKVYAARQRLLEIRPDLTINAVPLEIPMPGHSRFLESHSPSEKTLMLIRTAKLLERLIDAHDIIFLLTDSRESRWLPSLMISTRYLRDSSNRDEFQPPSQFEHLSSAEVLADPDVAASRISIEDQDAWSNLFLASPLYPFPLGITVALGFDSFVVLRHGQRTATSNTMQQLMWDRNHEKLQNPLLACYFCNDLGAPTDSMSQRSLDQQCTVTRPGLSGIASGIATELVAALSQHPKAPFPIHSSIDSGPTAIHHSCLGAVPHTIRGNLGNFQIAVLQMEAFKHCICCSEPVCEAYCSAGPEFLVEAVRRSEILEELSGLRDVKQCCHASEILYIDDDLEEESLID